MFFSWDNGCQTVQCPKIGYSRGMGGGGWEVSGYQSRADLFHKKWKIRGGDEGFMWSEILKIVLTCDFLMTCFYHFLLYFSMFQDLCFVSVPVVEKRNIKIILKQISSSLTDNRWPGRPRNLCYDVCRVASQPIATRLGWFRSVSLESIQTN